MLKWLNNQIEITKKKRDDPNRNIDSLGYWAAKVNAYIEVVDQIDVIIDDLREKRDECESRWNECHLYTAYGKMKAYDDIISLLGGDIK